PLNALTRGDVAQDQRTRGDNPPLADVDPRGHDGPHPDERPVADHAVPGDVRAGIDAYGRPDPGVMTDEGAPRKPRVPPDRGLRADHDARADYRPGRDRRRRRHMRAGVHELRTAPSERAELARHLIEVPTARDHEAGALIRRRPERDHGHVMDPAAHPGGVEPLDQRDDV